MHCILYVKTKVKYWSEPSGVVILTYPVFYAFCSRGFKWPTAEEAGYTFLVLPDLRSGLMLWDNQSFAAVEIFSLPIINILVFDSNVNCKGKKNLLFFYYNKREKTHGFHLLFMGIESFEMKWLCQRVWTFFNTICIAKFLSEKIVPIYTSIGSQKRYFNGLKNSITLILRFFGCKFGFFFSSICFLVLWFFFHMMLVHVLNDLSVEF